MHGGDLATHTSPLRHRKPPGTRPGTSHASSIAPVIVGLVVVGGTFLGFALTGAAMNPARALGPAWAGDVWGHHWIYWIGPLAGAAMAAFVYEGFYVGRLLPGKDQ